jgi:hypothetical protein
MFKYLEIVLKEVDLFYWYEKAKSTNFIKYKKIIVNFYIYK